MAHYTSEQLASFPWIVSCDTLRPEDLLVRFWQAAETVSVLADRPHLLNSETVATLERLVGEDSNELDWDDHQTQQRYQEQASYMLEALTDALNDAAPAAFSFGSSDGDGACFGFWLCDEWQDAMEHLGSCSDDPAGLAELISRLILDGIEPDTIEDSYCGRAEGWSEERAGADYAQELADEQGLMAAQPGWPFSCIDWEDAWRELELGDGYRLHDIGGGEWLVFRSV